MWSDNESSVDLLGCQHLVTGISSIIRNKRLLPATIGVFGDWGSGKSSLLRMAAQELEKDPDTLVISFNGWLFEGHEDAKTALMGTILDEIIKKKTLGHKALKLAAKLLSRINIMKLLVVAGKAGLAYSMGGLPAAGLSTAADLYTHDWAGKAKELFDKAKDATKEIKSEELSELLKNDVQQEHRRGIREFRHDFKELLSETNIKTLVVIVDDLDRCLPDCIIETLEAIKLFLFVEQTAFILGADERIVRYAVRKRFPELPGERAEVGRDYLEKLVQFPVRVPPLGRAEIETYINVLFSMNAGLAEEKFESIRAHIAKVDPSTLLDVRFDLAVAKTLLGDKGVPQELLDGLSTAARIAPVLASGLAGNPRQCKRFLNMLIMRIKMAESRKIVLQQRVLAKLMLLEYFRPESFKRLAEVQSAQFGIPDELKNAENSFQTSPVPKSTTKRSNQGDDEEDRTETPKEVIPTWLSDSWGTEWLLSEPRLSGVDLRPYFYFSRDLLGPQVSAAQRMSPRAEELLRDLFNQSEAVRKNARKKSKDLSDGDAAAVFESLAVKVRQEEDLSYEQSAFMRIFDFTKERLELFGQLITLLELLPESNLPAIAAVKLASFADVPDRKQHCRTLLQKWSSSTTNQMLKSAAGSRLTKLQ